MSIPGAGELRSRERVRGDRTDCARVIKKPGTWWYPAFQLQKAEIAYLAGAGAAGDFVLALDAFVTASPGPQNESGSMAVLAEGRRFEAAAK